MCPKHRRTEAQRRHDVHLHEAHHNPIGYYVDTVQDMTKTVNQHRERARGAEADAKRSKKALACTQNEVRHLVRVNKRA